jgi:hypothetical protein
MLGILLLPYKIESWYAVTIAPMLLIPRRWATAAFLGVTAACDMLHRNLFFRVGGHYLQALGLGIAVTLVVGCLTRSGRGSGGAPSLRSVSDPSDLAGTTTADPY